MKPALHSRPLRRLALLGVVPVVLGVPLFLWSQQPRPHTESDKWLWEQGEKVPSLEIMVIKTQSWHKNPISAGLMGLSLNITDRQGIRTMLRSFEKTGPFRFDASSDYSVSSEVMAVSLGSQQEFVYLCKTQQGYRLVRNNDHTKVAKTDPRSASRFLQAVRAAIAQAKHRQAGYALKPLPRDSLPDSLPKYFYR